MKDKRIGNDISVKWSLLVKGTGDPFDLSGLPLKLYLKNMYGRKALEDFSVQDNQILWTFYGKDQKHTGKYSLELVVNEGVVGMMTTDICDLVRLVSCSCKAGEGTDECGVETETIEVQSEVEFVAGAPIEVDTKLFELVRNLPAKGKAGKVYLVVNENGPNDNSLIEWIWINERWEKLGEFKADVDLSEYAKKIYVDQAIAKIPAPESSVFEAVYGETTFEEIMAAKNSGKIVICNYLSRITYLVYVLDSTLYFQSESGDVALSLFVSINSSQKTSWNYKNYRYDHTLLNLDNGNVQVTIAGNSAEVATPQYVENAIQQSGTPSGDPMHYMYEAVGAEWNGTGADIERTGIYGDTITWKAGYWYLNELGDITNEEMRMIYAYSFPMQRRMNIETAFAKTPIRTNIAVWDADRTLTFGSIAHSQADLKGVCAGAADMETFAFIKGSQSNNIQKHLAHLGNSFNRAFYDATKLRKIIGYLNVTATTDYQTFMYAEMLEEVRMWKITNDFSFAYCSKLSKASLLFAITNSAATKAITITLHADAYARLAEDADIVAALAEKEFVSLASA